jgi:hypothetical protein
MSKQDSEKHRWTLCDYVDGVLRPHADYDAELMRTRLQQGDTVHVQFKKPRNVPRHRRYWAVIQVVIKNNEMFATDRHLHRTLLMGCGVVEPVITIDGDIVMIPSSTAFDAMDEGTFRQYFDAAMNIINTHIMPGVEIDELLAEADRASGWKEAA